MCVWGCHCWTPSLDNGLVPFVLNLYSNLKHFQIHRKKMKFCERMLKMIGMERINVMNRVMANVVKIDDLTGQIKSTISKLATRLIHSLIF